MYRSFICNKCIGDTEQFNVSKECPGSGSTDVVGNQESASIQHCTKGSSFAARCSTKVQNVFPWSDWKKGCRCHGTWFLQIEKSGLVEWTERWADIFRIKISIGDPRNRSDRERDDPFEFITADFCGIYTKPVSTRCFITF